MATTPIWISLAVGLLGGLGSAMLTQYVAGRREAAARSYEHRRDAYVNFITKFYEYWRTLNDIKESVYPDPPDDYLDPLYDLLMQIQIFGTAKVSNLAEKALDGLSRGVEDTALVDIIDRLLHQIRRDLSIPGRRKARTKPEPVCQEPKISPPPVPPPFMKPN